MKIPGAFSAMCKKVMLPSCPFFKIPTNRSGNFPELSHPSLAIFSARRNPERMCRRQVKETPGFFRRNFPRPIRQFSGIATSGPDNFLNFPQTDLTIIFYCHIQSWQFLKIPANRSDNFSKNFTGPYTVRVRPFLSETGTSAHRQPPAPTRDGPPSSPTRLPPIASASHLSPHRYRPAGHP